MSNWQPRRSPVALGGLMAALAAVFGMMSQLLPFFFDVLAPLPLALAAILLSRSVAVAAAVAASLLLGMLTGPLAGLGFFLRTAIVGVVCGWFVQARRRYAVIFCGTTLAQVIGSSLWLAVMVVLMGVPLPSVSAMEENLFASAERMNLYATLAESGMDATQAEAMFANAVHTVVRLTPAIYVLFFACLSGVILFLLHLLCRRLRTPVQVPAPRWKAILMPPAVLVPVLFAWVALLLERHFANPLLWIFAANVMVIGAAGMVLDGLSYILDRLKFSEKPPVTQCLFILLALLMGWYLIAACAIIGVFDSIADYRHLRSQKGEESQ